MKRTLMSGDGAVREGMDLESRNDVVGVIEKMNHQGAVLLRVSRRRRTSLVRLAHQFDEGVLPPTKITSRSR